MIKPGLIQPLLYDKKTTRLKLQNMNDNQHLHVTEPIDMV